MIAMLNTNDDNFLRTFDAIQARGQADMQHATQIVSPLLEEIRTQGLTAVLRHVARFDGFMPNDMTELIITQEECKKAYQSLDATSANALNIAYKRIYAFHEKQKHTSWLESDEYGNMLGQRYTPMQRAGLYIPGGKAAYPSSVLMNAIPALVAGVPEIIVCTPTSQGFANPLLLAALHICGIQQIYRIGGASAIGVLAYGLDGLAPVDVISGPGNIYVAAAKKLVFGRVGIDMIAGPSEIVIIADDDANPIYIARDMLAQAEHDEMASAMLFTTSAHLAKEVEIKLKALLPSLKRAHIAEASLRNRGAIICCKSIYEALDLCNDIAPEHVELLVAEAFSYVPAIRHAGAIFLGGYTPEVIGDYLAGPNHTLPTGGSARFFSPLSVDTFMKKSSLLAFSKEGLTHLAHPCARLAELEGLEAHKLSVLERMK